MAFVDEFKEKTMDMAQVGVAKSKQLVDIAKLNMANISETETIRKAYTELGRLYYAERGMAPEAAYVGLCEKITGAKAALAYNRTLIKDLKGEHTEGKTADVGVVVDVPCEEPVCNCGCTGEPEVEVEPVAEDPNASDYEEL